MKTRPGYTVLVLPPTFVRRLLKGETILVVSRQGAVVKFNDLVNFICLMAHPVMDIGAI